MDRRLATLQTAGFPVTPARLDAFYEWPPSGELPADEGYWALPRLEAIPKDPFDGEPLRYRRLERGYVVYGIGPGGVDDGGAEEVDRNRDRTHDITLRVTR